MLKGSLKKRGYDWWWHSFTGYHKKTGEKKSFFIEYFIINPALGKELPTLGQLPYNKEHAIRPSYIMIKAGCWGEDAKQIHQFYPIQAMVMQDDKLELTVGECKLSETSIKGKVKITQEESEQHPEYMSDYGELSWDLKVNKKIAFNVGYGASKFFRKLNAFEMYWHAEGIKTEYEGSVMLDGHQYEILPQSSYGYADKNWGADFTSPWVWLSSCHMVSQTTNRKLENSAIDIGGGCPKVFGIPFNRKLLIDFFYEGENYEFNFSKFWQGVQTSFNVYETETQIIWEVTSKNRKYVIEVKVCCDKKEMLWINYEAPNGLKLHNKLWNGGTGVGEIKLYKKIKQQNILIDEIIMKNVGCEYGEYDK